MPHAAAAVDRVVLNLADSRAPLCHPTVPDPAITFLFALARNPARIVEASENATVSVHERGWAGSVAAHQRHQLILTPTRS